MTCHGCQVLSMLMSFFSVSLEHGDSSRGKKQNELTYFSCLFLLVILNINLQCIYRYMLRNVHQYIWKLNIVWQIYYIRREQLFADRRQSISLYLCEIKIKYYIYKLKCKRIGEINQCVGCLFILSSMNNIEKQGVLKQKLKRWCQWRGH